MGKQLQIFMTINDEIELIDYIYESNDYIIDVYGNIISGDKDSINKLYKYYIVPDDIHHFKFNDSGQINQLESNVIEIVRCSTRNENNKYIIFNQEEIMGFNDNTKKTLFVGRIWVELKYLNESNKLVKKNEKLYEKYKKYEKYFKTNYKKGSNPRYYIGSNAYTLYKDYGFKMHDGIHYTVDF